MTTHIQYPQAFTDPPTAAGDAASTAPPAITRRGSMGGAGGIGVEQEDGEGPGRRRWVLGHVSGVYLRR